MWIPIYAKARRRINNCNCSDIEILPIGGCDLVWCLVGGGVKELWDGKVGVYNHTAR